MNKEMKIEEVIDSARARGFKLSRDLVEDLLTLHCKGDFSKLNEELERIFVEYGNTLKG